MKSVRSFLCLPKEMNQRKGTRVTGPAEGGMPCAPRCCRGFANSLRSNSANPLFGSLSGARLRANGSLFSPICPAAPRRRGRQKTREVSEDSDCLRAKPEFFRVPPSARSKGSPQGQDCLGCLFLVSSFGHAKEEKENSKKASPLSPEFPDELFFCSAGGKTGIVSRHPLTAMAPSRFRRLFCRRRTDMLVSGQPDIVLIRRWFFPQITTFQG